jgi:hypothetical protein
MRRTHHKWPIGARAKGGKYFFFVKKKQKTFLNWVRASEKLVDQINKSFLLLFSKKKRFPSPHVATRTIENRATRQIDAGLQHRQRLTPIDHAQPIGSAITGIDLAAGVSANASW